MELSEARAWIVGNSRSMTNMIPQHPIETWLVRIEEADAAKIQQAYWVVRAHRDGLLCGEESKTNETAFAEAKRLFALLTDDERMEILLDYCTSCGCDNPRCQCWNDE